MLTIGDHFPTFTLKGVISTDIQTAFTDINHEPKANEWRVYFFWPKDFTFVCPTEIVEFGNLYQHFKDRDTALFGISTDSEFVHLAWKQQNKQLENLPFPMLSDLNRTLSQTLGILDQEGVAKRAVFIVDPENMIRFTMVTDSKVGRNPSEVLRVLDALQTDELCPCNWQKGDHTLNVI